jgi:four helix bundle protein
LEETAYWLELIAESGVMNTDRLSDFQQEANELTAVLVTRAKNAKKRRDE